ncbi:MAG: hypothetical protein IPP57_21195 [Candidatus Obscuribacter sp.]|nr:hypothetical protein [Candidatus Obscuribacter sp.]
MKIKSKAHHYLRAGAPACLFALSYLILSSAWLPGLAQSSPAKTTPAQATQLRLLKLMVLQTSSTQQNPAHLKA